MIWEGLRIAAKYATGRATIVASQLNRKTMVAIREQESLLGRHPSR